MERLRAALLGCLLTGGVIFGARPVLPEKRLIRPVVYAAGPGGLMAHTAEELARWFSALPEGTGTTITAPRPAARLLKQESPSIAATPTGRPTVRRRCNAARVYRRMHR